MTGAALVVGVGGGSVGEGRGGRRASALVVGAESATASRTAAAVVTPQQTSDEQGCAAVEGSRFAVAYPR